MTGDAPAGMDGLRTDQAPPLAIPVAFFLLAPLSMAAVGGLLLWHGADVLSSRYTAPALAATHLGTLGFLGSAMLGSLYPMLPVVAGAPVPGVRLAHAVQGLFAAGVAALAGAFLSAQPRMFSLALALLVPALLLFYVPATVALVRAEAVHATTWGMRLAFAGLGLLAVLGVWMALARSGHAAAPAHWNGWVAAHAALGGAAWVGGLLTAVSWQVVPMFYLAPPLAPWTRWLTLAAGALTLLLVPCVLMVGGGAGGVLAAVSPLLLAVFVVHPLEVARVLRARRRKRVDDSARFWLLGMLAAPVVLVLAAWTYASESARPPVLLGFVATWGWAGAVVHGMLTRIVPFLAWFERYSALVGLQPVPSMKELLPEGRVRAALLLHAACVLAGAVAILTGGAPAARTTGALFVLTAVVMLANVVAPLLPRRQPGGRPTCADGRSRSRKGP